ncbi:unnamed protein product [Fusarium equiseti]|uniref:Uncharacterized protein n=1 Tax=Fusarium equiseti TaxID=61235 RepID=A0A8J2NED1_FUSEQ|nr:unnamed protein product [Fusarium equiseti]
MIKGQNPTDKITLCDRHAQRCYPSVDIGETIAGKPYSTPRLPEATPIPTTGPGWAEQQRDSDPTHETQGNIAQGDAIDDYLEERHPRSLFYAAIETRERMQPEHPCRLPKVLLHYQLLINCTALPERHSPSVMCIISLSPPGHRRCLDLWFKMSTNVNHQTNNFLAKDSLIGKKRGVGVYLYWTVLPPASKQHGAATASVLGLTIHSIAAIVSQDQERVPRCDLYIATASRLRFRTGSCYRSGALRWIVDMNLSFRSGSGLPQLRVLPKSGIHILQRNQETPRPVRPNQTQPDWLSNPTGQSKFIHHATKDAALTLEDHEQQACRWQRQEIRTSEPRAFPLYPT